MRDRRLLDRKRPLKIADAHLAAAAHEDIQDGEPNGMRQEPQIGAHALQPIQIDLWSRADRAPSAPCPFGRIDDESCSPPCHAEIVSYVSMIVNTWDQRSEAEFISVDDEVIVGFDLGRLKRLLRI